MKVGSTDHDDKLKQLEIQQKQKELQKLELDLEFKKLTREADHELKRMEIQTKQQEIALKLQESQEKTSWLSRWSSPVALALVAAMLGYLGTMFNSWRARTDENTRHKATVDLEELKHRSSVSLEKQKLQGSLILDALKTGDGEDKSKKAALNLLLLVDAKLIEFDPDTKVQIEKWSRGEGGLAPGLPGGNSNAANRTFEKTQLSKIREQVEFAVANLNELFGVNYTVPQILTSEFSNMAYYDPVHKTVHYSPTTFLPRDAIYREVVHIYTPTQWWSAGEGVALVSSFGDVFASVLKQRFMKQSEHSTDWFLYRVPENSGGSQPARPLVSLKSPGSAFPGDTQIGHMSKFRKTGTSFEYEDQYRYDNSGIPNKAFYEVAILLGTEKAAIVWINSIKSLAKYERPTFALFAKETIFQGEKLHGSKGKNTIINAWSVVGVVPDK